MEHPDPASGPSASKVTLPENKEVASVEDGVQWVEQRIRELLASGASRPLLLAVYGHPNSGKSRFISAVARTTFFASDPKGLYTGGNPLESDERWAEAATYACIPLHDGSISGSFQNEDPRLSETALLAKKRGRPVDIGVYLYNPKLGHGIMDLIRLHVDIVICNEASQRKVLGPSHG